MPRITRTALAAAIAARPFGDDPTTAYGALPAPMRAAIAKSIADDRASGLSGNALRSKYGEGLTGPRRRIVLREHGYGAVVGRSYGAYRDGEPRPGSAHARLHGPNAADRIAAAQAAVEAAERKAAAKAKRNAKAAERRAAKAAERAATAKAADLPGIEAARAMLAEQGLRDSGLDAAAEAARADATAPDA